ncbi:MAG: sugar phosphate isomerase/epimerase, partial [Chloroflexi bacterium]|nr:sugar phosphate isomerase/epimerase [Chloroflexota bacterium]
HIGVCLDFRNFDDLARAQKSIELLAPYAIHVHAKSRAFDEAGEEATIDYRTCLSALKAAKYDGAISIEYEGDGDAATGIQKTRDLIEKYWERDGEPGRRR